MDAQKPLTNEDLAKMITAQGEKMERMQGTVNVLIANVDVVAEGMKGVQDRVTRLEEYPRQGMTSDRVRSIASGVDMEAQAVVAAQLVAEQKARKDLADQVQAQISNLSGQVQSGLSILRRVDGYMNSPRVESLARAVGTALLIYLSHYIATHQNPPPPAAAVMSAATPKGSQ